MDAIALAPALASGGIFAVLAIIIGYLLTALDKAQRRADESIAAADRRADEWVARARETQRLLDEARTSRRSAEDRADQLERQVRTLDAEVKDLRAEVADLRAQLG